MRAASLLLFLLVSACKQAPPKDVGTSLVGSSVGQKSQERTEDMLVRISEIEIDPTHLEEYKAILKEEAAASVRLEPGVIAIFPMHRRDEPTAVRILEIYASREAYEAHIKSPHFQKYKTTTQAMVKALRLVDMEAMDAAMMPNIFERMLGKDAATSGPDIP
jgi:quinol monooxygenase YgiN